MTGGALAEVGHDSLLRSDRWGSLFALLLPFAAVVTVAAASGGFNPTSFGWTTIAFAWVVIIAVTLARPVWGIFDLAWTSAAALVCGYAFVSAMWSGSAATAVNGGQRSLEYLTAIVASLLAARRGRISLWLGGAALGAGAVSVYSLATRLFPSNFGAFNAGADYRLFVPVGYWNALGIFAAIGALTGFGVAVAGRGRVLRVLSAVTMVPLLAALYFTFSRGAFLAMAAGLIAMVAIGPRRLRLLAAALFLAPLPALGVLIASRSPSLTHKAVPLAAASHAGHGVAIELAVLAVAQAAVASVYVLWLSRVRVSATFRRIAAVVVIVVLAFALGGFFAVYGSPPTLARHAYHSFASTPTGGADLNSRLFTLSNNGRTVLWRSALDDFEAHPVVGSGSGSFGRWWLAHRTTGYFVEDAHNLYAQALAEGGVIGMALLLAMLGVPFVAAFKARRHPLVAPAFGAYAAFLIHSAVDWDWQMPAVTLLALFAGSALVVAARDAQPRQIVGGSTLRVVLGVLAALAAIIAFVGLIGNLALANAQSGILDRSGLKAVSDAEKAHRWAPWSAVALRALGESRLLVGQRRAGLAALRESVAKDPGDWQTWYDLAAVTTGADRRAALARARALNRHASELTTAALRLH